MVQEYPGGIPAWVKQLDYETRADLSFRTPPIVPDMELLEETLAYQRKRCIERLAITGADTEAELTEALQLYAPKFVSNCQSPVTGRMCDMAEACWNRAVAKDPLASGLYQKRKDRAEVEDDE